MSDKDKWGRIPAKLIEVNQDFCALNWGELPCQAGPQSNIMIYSGRFGDSILWTTDGAVTSGGVPDEIGDTTFSPNDSIDLDPGTIESVFVDSAERGLLPVLTASRQLHCSFVYDVVTNTTELSVELRCTDIDGVDNVAKFSYDPTTETSSTIDPEINDITIDDTANVQWKRVSFWVDSADLVAEGKAFTSFLQFVALAGTSPIEIGLPQISLDELTEYRQTEEDPIFADDEPCFNTLSTCQAPHTYSIDSRTDGFLPTIFNGTATYTSSFQGERNEGLYLEFYFSHFSLSETTFRETLIEVGNVITVEIANETGENDKLTFNAGGVSLDYFLDDIRYRVYKVAVFYSRSGTLSVRGVDATAEGTPFTEVPQFINITNNYDQSPDTPLQYALADILVYDYQARQINIPINRQQALQKGDVFGDALFYAKLNIVDGLLSESGISPTGDFSDAFISESALSDPNITPLQVDLKGFGLVDLLEPPLILRFTERDKSSRLPESLRAIPSMDSASNKPAQLSVGGTNENVSAIGTRDELMVMFTDHPYSDLLVDPYIDQRSYVPEEQGTFWGKWIARNLYREGFDVNYSTGYENELGGFEREHTYSYKLDKISGPSADNKVQLKAYDILQELRGDRAVYPAANTGRLAADITAAAGSFTLNPVGIGDEEYSDIDGVTPKRVRIGGEGMDVTRSGDNFTISARGFYGGAESHTEDDLVQIVAQFEGEQVHDIAYTIITTARPELAGNIPKAEWDGLAADFLPRLYSADITEPTSVEDLLAELTVTAPIYFTGDIRDNQIKLGVIREPAQVAVEINKDNGLIADSVKLTEYPKERIDEVWVYYRIRDAAADIEDEENYSQRFILVNAEEQIRRGRRSIKRIYTRWIVAGARDTAEEIAQAYISRFQNTPIKVSFDLDAKDGDIWLGDVVKLISRQKQDQFGNPVDDLNYQVIQAKEKKASHQFSYLVQSYEFFAPVNPNSITITIQPEDTVDGVGAVTQIDLRELYDATVATEIDDITFVVAGGPQPSGGTVIGAGSGETWSLNNPNDWPWAPTISLRIEEGGVICGRAGFGGDGGGVGSLTGGDGTDGQTGLRVRYATSVNNLGIIGGGGGGAGGGGAFVAESGTGDIVYAGGGGGGGAGRITAGGDAGAGNFNGSAGSAGTPTAGGAGGSGAQFPANFVPGNGGSGGGLGQAGATGQTGTGAFTPSTGYAGGAGGSPGLAIDGVSNITFITEGDIRGNRI